MQRAALRAPTWARAFTVQLLDAGAVAAAVGAAAGRAALTPPPSPRDALFHGAQGAATATNPDGTPLDVCSDSGIGSIARRPSVPLWLADVAVRPRVDVKLHVHVCSDERRAAARGPARPLPDGGPGTERGDRRRRRLRARGLRHRPRCPLRFAVYGARVVLCVWARTSPAAAADAAV